jgi:hypothetical protein
MSADAITLQIMTKPICAPNGAPPSRPKKLRTLPFLLIG